MSEILTTIPTVTATKRDERGSKKAKELRAQGLVTGQIYGKGGDNVELTFNHLEMGKALNTVPTILEVELEGTKEYGLIKEVQYDTFGQEILNIDLMRVELTDTVEIKIPLDYMGTPKGADDGGRLEVMWTELPVRIRADSIPDLIEVSVGALKLNDALTMGDVTLPEGSELLYPESTLITRCTLPRRVAALRRSAGLDSTPTEAAAEGEAPEGGEG